MRWTESPLCERAAAVRPAVATFGFGAGLVLAGATFDTPSLYVPGVALGVLAAGMAAWVALASRGAGLVRAPGPHTVVEEEPWPLRIEVRTALLPLPGGELHDPLLGWPVPVAGRWSRRVRMNVRFSRRGRHRLEPGTLLIRDPLRLCARERRGEAGDEILVLPRTEPVQAAGRGGEPAVTGDGAAGRRLERAAAELEVDGLRPYREGAPATRIHWPSVARTGEVLERRLVADLDSAPLVVLDASRPESDDALDRAVRAAASLCLHLGRAGGCAVLLPGDRRPVEIGPDLGAWPHLHVRLALVEAGAAVGAPARAARAGPVLWVSASRAARAPRALERLPAAARYLVTPAPLPGRRAAFTVAGCSGHLLDRPRRAPQRRVA